MKVAVGVITNDDRHVLVTQRPLHASSGGLWEFPGGKLEVNETADEALVRELKEELDLDVLEYDFLGEVRHQYPDRCVELFVYHVSQFSGVPRCMEGQLACKWLEKKDMNPNDFPEANSTIFALLGRVLGG